MNSPLCWLVRLAACISWISCQICLLFGQSCVEQMRKTIIASDACWWLDSNSPIMSSILFDSTMESCTKQNHNHYNQIITKSSNFIHVYCIHHMFCESNFLRIGTSRHFREWLNSRLRRRSSNHGRRSEKSVSFTHLHVHCVLYYLVLRIHNSHSCVGTVGIGGKFIFAYCWIRE